MVQKWWKGYRSPIRFLFLFKRRHSMACRLGKWTKRRQRIQRLIVTVELAMLRHASSIRIQAITRGMLARIHFQTTLDRMLKHHSAAVIQRAYRCFAAKHLGKDCTGNLEQSREMEDSRGQMGKKVKPALHKLEIIDTCATAILLYGSCCYEEKRLCAHARMEIRHARSGKKPLSKHNASRRLSLFPSDFHCVRCRRASRDSVMAMLDTAHESALIIEDSPSSANLHYLSAISSLRQHPMSQIFNRQRTIFSRARTVDRRCQAFAQVEDFWASMRPKSDPCWTALLRALTMWHVRRNFCRRCLHAPACVRAKAALRKSVYTCPHLGQETNLLLARKALQFLEGRAADMRSVLQDTGLITCSRIATPQQVQISGRTFTVTIFREGFNILVEAHCSSDGKKKKGRGKREREKRPLPGTIGLKNRIEENHSSSTS